MKQVRITFLLGLLTLLMSQGLYAQVIIQAENYSDMSGVQTEACTDVGGGINVGWIDNGDWLDYEINVGIAGSFDLSFRVASQNGGGFNILDNGSEVATVDIPATGDWQNWETVVAENVALEKGINTIRILAVPGGFNINWLSILMISPLDTDLPTKPEIIEASGGVHDIKLVWNSSSDKTSGVAGYRVMRDSSLFAFTQDTALLLSKIAPNQTFNLAILATDWAGNVSSQVTATVQTDTLPWELAWADEFEIDGKPNPDNWYYETGGHGWGNNELQNYTAGDNADVKDGALVIEVRKEKSGSNDFSSTRLNSTKPNDFLYGRIEVKAKLPSTKGSWPAIWTLPTEWVYGGWPDCGEIDIMEHSATYGYGYVFGTIHTGAYNHEDGTQRGGGVTYDDVSNTYHTYAIEWYPDHIDWYYDDVLVFSFANEYKTTAEWPYDIPHHLLLNVAVGGGLGGDVDYNGEWPQQMIVDYVRVYDFKLNEQDTIAPEAPRQLAVEPKWSTAQLSWLSSIDNYGVEKYIVFVNELAVDTVIGTTALIQDLEAETEYSFGVKAIDYAGNISDMAVVTASTTAISGIEIPGKIEAENYTLMHNIDTEDCEDVGGGLNVGWIEDGSWLTYTIDVKEDVDYKAALRVAGEGANCIVELLNDDGSEITTIDFSVSGGWQSWKTVVSESFRLKQGIHTIKLNVLSGGFNLNWIKLGDEAYVGVQNNLSSVVNIYPNPVSANKLNIDLPIGNEKVEFMLYSIDGKLLRSQAYSVANNRIEIINLNLRSGVYIVELQTSKGRISKKIQVE